MAAALKYLRRRLKAQSGFTMIDSIVALTVLAVGILGTGMGLDTSRRLSLVSERHATMAHIAQKEIERLEGIPYSNIAMSSAPGPQSTNAADPDYYLINGSPPSLQW